MDVCIKNIDEENWRFFKSESAKHGVKTGEFFNKLVHEHQLKCKESNWEKVLYGKKPLKGLVTQEDLREIRKDFRNNFTTRKK